METERERKGVWVVVGGLGTSEGEGGEKEKITHLQTYIC